MSSRALRKALRARELAALSQNPPLGAEDADAESDGDDAPPPLPQKQSLFALLGGVSDAEDSPPTDDDDADADEQDPPVIPNHPTTTTTTTTPAKKKKKKKKKKKPSKPVDGEDEIDAALRELALAQPAVAPPAADVDAHVALCEVLKIDARNFDAANEMRRLFGRAALDGAEDAGGGGRGGRGGGGGGAAGRGRGEAAGGRGRGDGRRLTARRNLFVQAKETWPVAGSGGLGMEVVREGGGGGGGGGGDGTTEFRFVHSAAYQDVQRQFMMCVASMDPNRLIQLLHHNPYHISTLLQASEIFAQQRDHTVAGDLLERALFTFGRSVHSTFSHALASGSARLSFQRPENREFWLCCTRYLRNLQMRGTWRTASEFARLILALSPAEDPHGVRLGIDFIALKARQPASLLQLLYVFRDRYAALPNMSFSAALAHLQLDQPAAAREALSKAITKFPWVVHRLWSALGIESDLPRVLWGLLPRETDALQPVLAELYVVRTADLWKDPLATQLLVDTASTLFRLPKSALIKSSGPADVPEDVARHVLMTDIPAVTALLPREWTRRDSPAYDPLPPQDSLRSYDASVAATTSPAPDAPRPTLLREFFMSLLPHLDRANIPEDGEIRRALREMGIDAGEMGLDGDGNDEEGQADGFRLQ